MVLMEDLIRNEYIIFFLILFGSIAVGEVLQFVLRNYVKRMTEKTKTDIDDILLNMATKPLHIVIILAGLYLSSRSLSVLIPYAEWIDNIFFVALVIAASTTTAKILSVFMTKWFKVQKKFEKTPQLLNKIVSVTVYLIALLMILGRFGIEITPLIATLGIGGLAVGLALQNTLSNLFAGLHIISDRPVNVGDFIELDGNISGYVEDIGWRSTRIKTLPNTVVIVPNSKLAESVITNNSLPELEMSIVIQCGVAYGSDLKKVEKVTIEVAKKMQETIPGAVRTFEPFIRYHTFSDSNINFSIIMRVEKFVDKYFLIHEFIKALKERYDKEGIEISWPVRKIYYGNETQKPGR
jgi:small-conductance mechanosensitive channel